jgi:hypothetical protein
MTQNYKPEYMTLQDGVKMKLQPAQRGWWLLGGAVTARRGSEKLSPRLNEAL